MLQLFNRLTIIFVFFVLAIGSVDGLQCYNTTMQANHCLSMDLWCIKFINGSDITRDCANVYDYCTDEDSGCYPEQEVNGIMQKWCCCQKDLCNSSSDITPLLSIITLSIISYFIQ